MQHRNKKRRELYPAERSPFSQKLTQRALAELLGTSVGDLHREVHYKEPAIVRRPQVTGRGKRARKRDLVYPAKSSSLYGVHERLAAWLNRIEQPDYIFSPRVGRTTRTNAEYHSGQKAFLQIDIKKFYPSTTKEMIRSGLIDEFAMYRDVANLISDLVTIDDKASFGSPVTPVLMTIVFRKMFDRIYECCRSRGLRMSVWVDDITISGKFITSDLLNEIREIVREYGHKTHKIRIRSAHEGVCITGIWLYGRALKPDHGYDQRLREALDSLSEAETEDEWEQASRRVLSAVGSIRHIAGPTSERGQQLANLAEGIRRERRARMEIGSQTTSPVQKVASVSDDHEDIPF